MKFSKVRSLRGVLATLGEADPSILTDNKGPSKSDNNLEFFINTNK